MRERIRTVNVSGRVLPHDEGAEAAVLSALLLSGSDVLDDVRATGIVPGSFYFPAHRDVYAAACMAADEGHPVDLTTVASTLHRVGKLGPVGGITYLTRIVDATPAVHNAEAHARIVVDLARRRAFIERLSFAQGRAWEHKGTTDEMVADSMAELDAVADDRGPTLTLAFDAVKSRIASLQEQWDGKREQTGMASSLPGLQPILGGYRLTGVSVLAGSTGGGKSSAGLQEVLGLAGTMFAGEKVGAVVISLEMDSDENVDRALAIESGVPDMAIQSGLMTDQQLDDLLAASDRVAQKPIWFQSSEVDLHGIRSAWRKADREFRRFGEGRRVRFVVVDFLGLVKLDDAERHDIALEQLMRGLKLFAMQERVHVMVLSQFSRAAAARDPWDEPQLSDIKNSSGIEQNSNQVLFIHRVAGVEGAEDYAGIVVGKNRKGEKGTARARFDGRCYRFVAPTDADIDRWQQARESSRPRRRRGK